LYVQHTDPAAYPPLEHSATLLSRLGWQVRFVGRRAKSTEQLRLPHLAGVKVTLLPHGGGGAMLRAAYLFWLLWAGGVALLWRPDWVYASDAVAAPAARLAARLGRAKLIYHEHDSATPWIGEAAAAHPLSRPMGAIDRARRRLAREAAVCIVPNESRSVRFVGETGAARVMTVWNCPLREEVAPPRERMSAPILWLHYHGNLDPGRLPSALVQALSIGPPAFSLRVVGYEAPGHEGYGSRLKKLAEDIGVADRFQLIGAVPTRRELLTWARCSDVGVALMPKHTENSNELCMVGASNKAFDYLACGMPLLVTDHEEWIKGYVEPGMALSCHPDQPESIAACLARFVAAPDAMRAMGERGRQRVLADWNYEHTFAQVLSLMRL
jgi:glycosyltransferase involved in cell wall biosynthesis